MNRLKGLNDSLYYAMNRVAGGLDGVIGGFFVQRATFFQQAPEDDLGRFVGVQQRPIFVFAGAFNQGF